MSSNHDHSYKLLFSHAEMVKDLLTGFLKEDWVGQLDYATLEKVSGSYITDELRDREDDVIWRVRWGDSWLYVYMLLEFQSTVDKCMAVRVMSYLGLLYRTLSDRSFSRHPANCHQCCRLFFIMGKGAGQRLKMLDG